MPVIERVDELEVFVATVTEGSLSGAARSLRMGVNRVSRKLARLEERLDRVLIVRTTRSLRITQAGEQLLLRARQVLDELAAAEQELVEGMALRGRVRLAIPTLLSHFGLLDEVLRAGRAHPELEIELLIQDGPVDLVSAGCDAVVVVGRPKTGSLKLVPLGTLSVVLAASPLYLDRAGTLQEPSDLQHHACLRFLGTETQTHWPLVGPGQRRKLVRIGKGLSSNDSRVLHDAMVQGAGIGLAAASQARQPHRRLSRVLPGYHHAPFSLFALCAASSSASVHARFAISLLKKGIKLSP